MEIQDDFNEKMIYEMKLQPQFFDDMQKGTKRIELRLNDEKRRQIELGDEIVFLKEPEKNEKLHTKVIGLLHYYSFEELLADIDISLVADRSMKKEELLAILQEFYPKEMQKEYGALGIRIQII